MPGARGGAGVAFLLGEQWEVGPEGLAYFGTATWKQTPFLNSSWKAYDPSMLGFFANVAYRWQ